MTCLLYTSKTNGKFDLNMYGVRKAEGGARRTAYKTCFSSNEDKCDEYLSLIHI